MVTYPGCEVCLVFARLLQPWGGRHEQREAWAARSHGWGGLLHRRLLLQQLDLLLLGERLDLLREGLRQVIQETI